MMEIAIRSEWEKANVMLTDREFEILKEIAGGYSSKEIGNRLGISLKTVEVHRHNILRKTRAKNSVHLCLELARKGLLK